MKENNPIVDKTKAFAIRIIRMCQHIEGDKKEIVLSRQVLRSGTNIGQMSEKQHVPTAKRILLQR